jgi:DNA-binding NtrC family response regulator
MTTTLQSDVIAGTKKNLSVCVMDGDPAQMVLTMNLLERAGFPAVGTARPDDALDKIRSGGLRIILADCSLAGMDSLVFLEKALRQDPQVYVVLISAYHSVDSAVEAIKHGSYDYLCKPIDYARLARTLDDLVEHMQHAQPVSVMAGQHWQPLPLSEMRRIHIHRVLETCNGNRVRAARILGIGRTSLYRFLKSADKQVTARVGA